MEATLGLHIILDSRLAERVRFYRLGRFVVGLGLLVKVFLF
jgi:hypothetical protein